MPPQQPDRLLDLFDEFLGFRAHVRFLFSSADVTIVDAGGKEG
jgi:hypothetical protein